MGGIDLLTSIVVFVCESERRRWHETLIGPLGLDRGL